MRRQRGVTMIGWIFLLFPVVLVGYALLRVGPAYYAHYKLVQAMKGAAANLKSDETLTPQAIRNGLDSRFNIEYVDVLTAKDIEVTKSADGGWVMRAEYEQAVNYIGNLHLLLMFDEVVEIN